MNFIYDVDVQCVLCYNMLKKKKKSQKPACGSSSKQQHRRATMVNMKSLLLVWPPKTSPLPSAPSLAAPPPHTLVCPHMFSVPSPFAAAAVIGKPGVLLFQRPGSVEREVILGPWRRALEHGGGWWTDKNQACPKQEHADFHTHKLSCTHLHYIHDIKQCTLADAHICVCIF